MLKWRRISFTSLAQQTRVAVSRESTHRKLLVYALDLRSLPGCLALRRCELLHRLLQRARQPQQLCLPCGGARRLDRHDARTCPSERVSERASEQTNQPSNQRNTKSEMHTETKLHGVILVC
eukprot:SAG11_NODE_18363_length_493_cov_0.789340_1_plen_121_part_01